MRLLSPSRLPGSSRLCRTKLSCGLPGWVVLHDGPGSGPGAAAARRLGAAAQLRAGTDQWGAPPAGSRHRQRVRDQVRAPGGGRSPGGRRGPGSMPGRPGLAQGASDAPGRGAARGCVRTRASSRWARLQLRWPGSCRSCCRCTCRRARGSGAGARTCATRPWSDLGSLLQVRESREDAPRCQLQHASQPVPAVGRPHPGPRASRWEAARQAGAPLPAPLSLPSAAVAHVCTGSGPVSPTICKGLRGSTAPGLEGCLLATL